MTKWTHVAVVCAAIGVPAAYAEDRSHNVSQQELAEMVNAGDYAGAFDRAFAAGAEITTFEFTPAQGVGAHIGEGRLFTRFPRADLDGPTEWANHFPKREAGANATTCFACHSAPFANGVGGLATNVILDPTHSGDPATYLERNPLPLIALGVPQKIAEEMSLELFVQRETARAEACASGLSTANLVAKGVSFGSVTLHRTQSTPCAVAMDVSGLEGINSDLIVRPFGWKGLQPNLRAFARAAAHNELGLQAVETVGQADGDFDGVTNELSVGDITALTVHLAAMARPVSEVELADLGLMDLPVDERDHIKAGEALFADIGCASCHIPQITVENTVFSEPTTTPGFYDATFPDGSDPVDHGLSMPTSVQFDLAGDQPSNQIVLDGGGIYPLGALEMNADGTAVARWYSDFKRHDMGVALADPIASHGIPASHFLTRSLAGVGATGPWLHDGRATTLSAAILAHGGDAARARDGFKALQADEQAHLVRFLENLTYYQAD